MRAVPLCLLVVAALVVDASAQRPLLKTGPNADLQGVLLMPPDDEWNRDVSRGAVDVPRVATQ